MDDPIIVNKFSDAWEAIQEEVHDDAVEKGFWEFVDEDDVDLAISKVMLIVTELAELVESLRCFNGFSEHIPLFTPEEEEAADAVIRIMDYSQFRGLS